MAASNPSHGGSSARSGQRSRAKHTRWRRLVEASHAYQVYGTKQTHYRGIHEKLTCIDRKVVVLSDRNRRAIIWAVAVFTRLDGCLMTRISLPWSTHIFAPNSRKTWTAMALLSTEINQRFWRNQLLSMPMLSPRSRANPSRSNRPTSQ